MASASRIFRLYSATFFKRVLLIVLIEAGNAVKLEDFNLGAFRHEFRCGSQTAAIA
jgi:hypothetical protein